MHKDPNSAQQTPTARVEICKPDEGSLERMGLEPGTPQAETVVNPVVFLVDDFSMEDGYTLKYPKYTKKCYGFATPTEVRTHGVCLAANNIAFKGLTEEQAIAYAKADFE